MKKDNIKLYIYSVIVVLSFILVAVGATFAVLVFADVIGNKKNGYLDVKTAYVTAIFNANQTFNDDNIFPGWQNYAEFEITNNSYTENAVGRYDLILDIENNEIFDNSFVYYLEGKSYKNGKEISNSSVNYVATSSDVRVPSVSSIIGSGIIDTGVTHKYKLTVKFLETLENQDYLQGKLFKARISASGK